MAATTDYHDLRERVRTAIHDERERIVEVAKWIHAHPELAYEERGASALLAKQLRDLSFTVERPFRGLETAFCAERAAARSGGSVAVIAEYDALPGIGHGCGHNLIAASSLAAAIGIGAVLEDAGGRFIVLGTPAEENGGGKIKLVNDGGFAGIDAALMIHHAGDKTSVPTAWPNGTSLTVLQLQVEYIGKPAHAAADPYNGVNALNAVILLFSGIDALRQHLHSEIRIHGVITNGGEAPNVVPAYTSAAIFVRTPSRAELTELAEQVRNIARGAALMTGCELRLTEGDAYADMRPSYVLGERFLANMEEVGLDTTNPRDGGRGMYSTDFGNVSEIMPAVSGGFAISHEPIPGHSPQVVAASDSEFGIDQMLKAATAMALTALEVLSSEELRERAWAEHRTWGQGELARPALA
jgi:amidohydrolase